MKKYILFGAISVATLLLSGNSQAQKPGSGDKKTKEIIIRKNGDKKTKMTIEIDGDNVTVNGKPLSEYSGDDVSIIKRDMRGPYRNFHIAPEIPEIDEDMDVNIFGNDGDKDMDKDGSRTFLGVMTETAPDGVKITNVIKGSAAEKAGLQKDDIITRVNDKKITSPEDLMEAVSSYKPEETIKIDYLRNNKKNDVNVKLGERKEKNRKYIYKYNPGMNGNGFNFKMPQMPDFPNKFNYRFRNNNHPKLGVKIEDIENGNGAKIVNVEEGSVADKTGLKKDDIITEINGEKVDNVDEIRESLNEINDKDSFNLKVKRNNSDMNFEVKIPKKLNSADL